MFALACGASHQASGHGGGLNSDGCHNNRKTGDYHCHRTPAAKPAFAVAAQEDANRVSAPRPAAVDSRRPQCFTGPRGGTYTITASGRKNYGGC